MHFKVPFFQEIKKYDIRFRVGPIEEKELTCSDNKRIVVNAFSYFCIDDVIKFYTSVNTAKIAEVRMRNCLESCMREVIGRFSLFSLLSSDRGIMMNQICDNLNKVAKNYGIKVADVRISKADLPNENRSAICRRMQTAREQEARKIIAEGEAEATNILASADKEKSIILANANKTSQIIRSEGDKEAAQIYNKCYSRDQEFFKFCKSLEAYKEIFSFGENYFILPSSSKFFEYLNLAK